MPQHAETVEEAWRLLGRGDYRAAAEISGRLLAKSPGDVSALCCNAMSNWQLGVDIERCIAMMRRGVGFTTAFRTVWLGEIISISVMELMMNLIDYHMGGMRAVSLTSPQYWEAFDAALVAGYLAALPVNKWMLSRNMKNCH